MIYNRKKNCSKVSHIDAFDGSYQVFYNSKFNFTAKSLVTNSVVISQDAELEKKAYFSS